MVVYGLAYFVPSIPEVSHIPYLITTGHGTFGGIAILSPPHLVGLGFLVIGGTIGDYFKRRLPVILVQTSFAIISLAVSLKSLVIKAKAPLLILSLIPTVCSSHESASAIR